MSERSSGIKPGVVLALMCGVQFMVILDLSVVNVAIPSIQADLGLAQADLQWVVVTYGVTLGGSLMLGGRAADLLGRRRVLAAGLALFTAASFGAGLANSLTPLMASRAAQGVGAALAATAALSIVVATFADGAARTKALGIFAAVGGSAASIGVIVSGALTDGPGWEWIFLVNVPIGIGLIALVFRFIAPGSPEHGGSTDIAGAVAVTGGLMAIVFAISRSTEEGWRSVQTLGSLAGGVVLLGLFVFVEGRVRSPLIPLAMFRRRTLVTAVVVAALMAGAFFATIFEATLFMQQTLGFSAIRTGLAWLASTASSLVVAGAIAPVVVNRFGPSRSLVLGQTIVAAGALLLSRASADASYWVDLFPGFLLFGVGLGFSMMAAQVAAFIGVEDAVAGLAGGMVETAREIGGALGTAVVATIVLARTNDVRGSGAADIVARTEGFQRGTLAIAGFGVAAALAAGFLLRPAERASRPPTRPTTVAEEHQTAVLVGEHR